MQVRDDHDLLNLMLEDSRAASEIYKPTNFWAVYEEKNVRELLTLGLHDFKRRKNTGLLSFSAPDISSSYRHINLFAGRILYNRFTLKLPFWFKFLQWQNSLLNTILPPNTTHEQFRELYYPYAYTEGIKAGARPMTEFGESLCGNPEDVFEIGDRVYTLSTLRYYLRYAYCASQMDFDSIKLLVELGSRLK